MTTLLPHSQRSSDELSTAPIPRADGTHPAPEMARWRDAVLEVQSAILSGTDVDAVLHAVADAARRLAGADVATVAVPRVAGTSLVLRAAAGYRARQLEGAVFPVEDSVSGQILRSGRAIHLPDAARHANAYQPICELGDLGPTMLMPLARGEVPFGTLLVARRRGRRDFTPEEFELLCLFAGHVSVAVEFCRSQEELQRLAEVETNERVGRELHDTVIQRLFAIGLRLQALSTDERSHASAQLQVVLDEIDDTVREIRSTVLENGSS